MMSLHGSRFVLRVMVFALLAGAGLVRAQSTQPAGFAVADPPAMAEGANLRVMSFNILSEEWNDKTPIDGRQETVKQTILHFEPDVVGLQEISAKWYGVLPDLLSAKYEMVHKKNSKGERNYTGMAYHKEKVKLLESGTDLFSVGIGGTRIRLVTWGHYQKLDGGAKFVVMNTHWCIRQENRLVHAREMAEIFEKYRTKYACPVITVGDYNAGQNNEAYKLYADKTGMKNARLDAKKVNRAIGTFHKNLGKTPEARAEQSIDQIFFTDDLTCLFYNVLIDPVILGASDHCPIYADFKLDKQ